MKPIVKSTLILTLITLIAGLCLSVVYQVTKQPIAEAERAAAMQAYSAVFPNAVCTVEAEAPAYVSESGVTVDEVISAAVNGTRIGTAVRVTTPNGYGGAITVAVGVDTSGKLTGISVISQGETAGLGANCEKDTFTSQFAGMEGEVTWTKSKQTSPNQIMAISGATVTTKAVTDAVNTALVYVRDVLPTKSATGGDMP